MWYQGYLDQARSDWEVYNILQVDSIPSCHALHYLQMTTEKLGKAMFLAGGTSLDEVRKTHRAFSRFIQLVARNRAIQKELGMTGLQLRMHTQHLLPLAYEIERLAPALADGGANVEYPWEGPLGTINVPAFYDFPVNVALQSPSGRSLLKLIKVTLERFYVFFF